MSVKRVLAALGGCPQDEPVLERAAGVAAAHGATMVVVHVVDLPGTEGDPNDARSLPGQAALAARERIEAWIAQQEGILPALDIRIVAGSAALRLIEICNETAPDLVVMRAHLRTGIAEKILGSTTERVIAGGACPVLVVKRPADKAYGRVLVTTDGKDDPKGALRFTRNLLPDAALTLVEVVQIAPQLEEAMLRIGTGQEEVRAHLDRLQSLARDRLAGIASQSGGTVRPKVLRGDPASVLLRAARSTRVDLIVAGAGRSGLLRRAFVGSVARSLTRDADCDVLIFHPDRTGGRRATS